MAYIILSGMDKLRIGYALRPRGILSLILL